MRCIQLRSAPAEKLLPLARSTTTRAAGSAPSRRKACVSSAMTSSSKALCTSGRSRVTVATPSGRVSITTLLIVTSHPEHAEGRLLHRRVQRGGEPEAEHHAGVGRIDDAVVPQASAGVVGMSLRLVLRADGSLERLLLLLG